VVNTAIEKMNADDTDAAEAAAHKAIMLNPFGPYGYVVLANVQQKRGKGSEAMALYRKSIEMAARDTAYDDIRRQSMAYLGNLAADSAEMAEAAARRPYTEAARTAFEQILADKGADNKDKDMARSGLCRVAIVAGDTASLRTTYKDQLTTPAGYQYTEIMNAGVCFARAELIPEATTLFRAAYEKNPYHRDALSNLAIMLLRADKHAEALPLAERLVEVEPNNQENMQLLVLANAGLAKSARDTRLAATKTAPTTKTTTKGKAPATKTTTGPRLSAAAQDSLFQLEKKYTDAAVSTNERREKLTYKVALTDFTTSETRATVAGSVTNQGTTVKPVTVRIDFLDATGKVVATKEQALGDLAAGRSQRFSITHTPGTNVAAFRYSRIE
jgi:tetratricopeptide (TPR) repeat protein